MGDITIRNKFTSESNKLLWANPITRFKRTEGIKRAFEARIGMTKEQLRYKINEYILNNKGTTEISKMLKISTPMIRTYCKDENKALLTKTNTHLQSLSNFKDGQRGLYRRLRTEVREGKHNCQNCSSNKNITIHHIEKINYNKFYEAWKADNFINTPDKIKFLCASCHQREHYRNYNRPKNNKKDIKTGRFIRGNKYGKTTDNSVSN